MEESWQSLGGHFQKDVASNSVYGFPRLPPRPSLATGGSDSAASFLKKNQEERKISLRPVMVQALKTHCY